MTTKAALIERIAENCAIPKTTASVALQTVLDSLVETVKKTGRYNLAGVGTFKVKARKARTGRNPQTGEVLKVKASKTVAFKPSPAFKEAVARTKV